MNKRQLQANLSKKKLFDSAQKLFEKYGYNVVTVEDICREAGVSKGLFYNYFPSKFSITLESIQPLEETYARLVEHFLPTQTATEKLCLLFRCILETTIFDLKVQKNARINYEREIHGGESLIYNEKRRLFTYLYQIVRDGHESRQFSAEITDSTIVNTVFRYSVGCIMYLFNVDSPKKQKEVIQQAVSDLQQICKAFEI